MKLFNKLCKNYFTTAMSLILLVLASLGLFNICSPKSVDASMLKFEEAKVIDISNGSFNKFSSSSQYPYEISGFSTSGNKTSNMKTGAINIGDNYDDNYDDYGDGFSLLDNPLGVGSDDYVLMINADEDSNYTYTTSSAITLPANGNYYITVSAKVMTNQTHASIFLTKDGKIFENCLIDNITSTTWGNYTFFVSTNSYESVDLKVGMQIGSPSSKVSGCVLFDELHAGQISVERLNDTVSTLNEGSFRQVKLNTQNAYKNYNFDSQIIEYTRNSKGEIVYDTNDNPVVTVTNSNYFAESVSGLGDKNFELGNNVLTLSTNDSYLIYKGQEEQLQANTTYKFSIFVKASSLSSGSAFVKLNEIIDEDEETKNDFMESTTPDMTPKSSSLSISSTTSNTVTNGYNEYTIYVTTGNESSTVQFSFGLGSDMGNATGEVSFKQYSIERVPYSAYSSASDSDTIGKIDISERLTLSSTEYANYSFDKMQSNSFDGIPYPATPTSWSKSSEGEGYQLSGVVNLNSFNKVMDKYSASINTISTPSTLNNTLNNNVLMIYNGTNSIQSYTSNSKTLSANKYCKITVFVNTYLWDNNANGVTIFAKNGSNVLAKASGIKTAGQWQRVEFCIHTSSSVDITLELALGSKNSLSSGYAFFDNILFEEVDAESNFSNRFGEYVIANNGRVELDLTNPMLASTSTRDYNTPVLYKGENINLTNINAGIVDLTGNLNMASNTTKQALRKLENATSVLSIASVLNEDSYYKYTSLLSYSFESSKYYKFSFSILTAGISQEDKENKYDNGKLAEGANIELTNLENAKFTYINTQGNWSNYEIYIGLNSSATSNLVFSLGSEFTGCYGQIYLGNIQVEEVEKDVFTSAVAGNNVLKVDTVAKEDDDTTEDTTEKSGNNFDWAYIPTILTFVAIVVAVVGIFVRRNVKFKKHIGNKKAEYDRDITVMQNKYRRLASDARDKEVREMTKECEELIALRNTYEEKYKDALSRLRSARLANRDGSKRHEIMAIEHEVKNISKDVSRFGVQVNNYENEIEFMKSEAYLIDLEKRMMREDNLARNIMRKEQTLSEEERVKAQAKREAKQQHAEQKAKAKAEKLANKQAKLQQQREQVELDLQRAKELDEKYLKEQELKQIRLEEQKVAKEKAKAERELQKLEQRKQSNNSEEVETEETEETNSSTTDETTETVDVATDVTPETTEETVETTEATTEATPETTVENSQAEDATVEQSETVQPSSDETSTNDNQ